MLYSVAFEFVGVGGHDDFVAADFCGDDLADDVLVGEATGISDGLVNFLVGTHRTTSLYFGALYLLRAWVINFLRA